MDDNNIFIPIFRGGFCLSLEAGSPVDLVEHISISKLA